jgi:hypothetical protein
MVEVEVVVWRYDIISCNSKCFYSVVHEREIHMLIDLILNFGVLMPLSAIFQLYHGDQF